MDPLNIFNKNIVFFYNDLNIMIDNEYNIDNISKIIKNNPFFFIEIVKNKLLIYKNDILEENNNIIPIIDKIFIYNIDFNEIYKKSNKKNRNILWKYIKIFILLSEQYYFTL